MARRGRRERRDAENIQLFLAEVAETQRTFNCFSQRAQRRREFLAGIIHFSSANFADEREKVFNTFSRSYGR